jgi:serine/threonine protein kinase
MIRPHVKDGTGMSHTPAQQWSALSALYEEADGLAAHELPAWIERLEREAHPLLPQLKRMLEARDRMATDSFLETMPRLVTSEDPRSDWSAGRRVGPYRLVRPLGEGGMAEVWLAERDDGAFKRQVAIKLPYPRPGRETFAVRFDRERDILASLRHPNIAGLFDAGVTTDGQAWLALEYVEGQPISSFCDERRVSVRDRVVLFRQVLLAVQHAHANLVIHRDLKPPNILVTPQGEVRLLDFGIAKLLESPSDAIAETELTRQAGRSMTPRYASPEQLVGLPLTTACDVYSLGVVFYELMCGERPYELKVESPAQLEHAILETEPRAMSRRALTAENAEARATSVKLLRRVLCPELDAIALRCLAKKPARRYSSVDAVLADIDRWLAGEPVLARTPSPWYRLRKFVSRHRLGAALGASAVLSLAASAAIAVVFAVQAREDSARAGAARDFMLSLFKRADQEKARGADITARELLESGRKDVLTRMSSQPILQAELLDGIGGIQADMAEYSGADSTFADAAKIYAQLGMLRRAALARTAQADAAMRAGDLPLTQQALDQARQLTARLPADAELEARIGEVAGWAAFIQAEMPRARDLFHASYVQARKALGPSHEKSINALRGWVYAEREMHHFDEALRLLGELDANVKVGPANPLESAELARDRAELFSGAGRIADSLEVFTTALPACAKDLGPNHSSCRELLFGKVNVMLRLGMTGDALKELPGLEAMAADMKSPAMAVDTLLLMLKLETLGALAGQRPLPSERVEALLDPAAKLPLSVRMRFKAVLALAEARLRMNDVPGAERWTRQASDLRARYSSASKTVLGVVARTMEGVVLANQGRSAEAIGAFKAAQDDLTALYGSDHPTTCLFSLNLASALEASGSTSDALAIVQHADPILRQAMGHEAPSYRRVQGLRERLERALAAGAAPPSGHSTQGAGKTSVPPSIDFFT